MYRSCHISCMPACARIAFGLMVLLVSGPVSGHPHVFIDAGLRFERDMQGRIVSVDVTWRYDELYTLILLEDYNLDMDFDLQLTESEIEETMGFDLDWTGAFQGGLTLMQDGAVLTVGPPVPVSLRLLPSGQMETTHRRRVLGAAPGGLTASVYDHEFYIAFEMILPVEVADAPSCTPRLVRADLDAAYSELGRAIEAIGGAVAAEDNFPQVGALFADRVEITCPGS